MKGGASVTVETPPPFIITAQEKIIPLSSKGVPDQAEAEAFQNRFCLRWHLRKALPKSQQDPQMKLAMRCGSCYSKWIDRNAEAHKLRAPDMEEQVIEMERAIQVEPAQLEQPARLPIEVSAAEHQCLLTPCFFVRQKFCAPIFSEPDHVTAVDMAASMIGEEVDSSVAANLECPLTPSRNMDVQEVEPWTPDGSPPVVTQANLGHGWSEVTPLFKRRRQ